MFFTVFCLIFYAFVQLLWNNRSYTRITCSHWIQRLCSVCS